MGKYHKQIIAGLAIALAVYIGLLIFFDTGSDLTGETLDAFADFPWLLVIPLALAQVAAGFFRFLEWHYFLGVVGARAKISVWDSAIIFVSAFTMVVSPGKAAELLKVVILKTKTDVPVARSAPIVLAERTVDGIAVIIATLIAVVLAGDNLDLGPYRLLVFSSAAILGFGLAVVQVEPLMLLLLNLLRRAPLVSRFHESLTEFYHSSREIFHLRHILPTTFLGVGVYLSSAAGFMLVLYGFGLQPTWTLFLQVTFMTGVTSAVGALSFIPNGAGVTEVSNAGMLLAFVAPANPVVTPAVAAAAAIMQGFSHKWFRVVVGMVVAFIFRERLFPPALDQEIEALENERALRKTASTSAAKG